MRSSSAIHELPDNSFITRFDIPNPMKLTDDPALVGIGEPKPSLLAGT